MPGVESSASLRLVVPLLLVLAACGGGDEATVENIGGTDSATRTGSATGAMTDSVTHGGNMRGAAACEPVGDPSTADTTIDVTLDEWSVQTPEPRVTAGRVTFAAQNVGELPHELVIVRADDPGALPVDEEGAVAEEKLPPDALVGEIEAFPPGTSCQGTFQLPPGEYVLLCNIVERHAGEQHVHYQLGMSTKLVVGP